MEARAPKVTHYNLIIKGQPDLSNFPQMNKKNANSK